MSKISIYDVVPVPKLADKLIGTSVGGEPEDLTYNFTLGELLNLFIPNIPGNTLQGVLDFGNTATQNINLTGIITTTTLNVGSTANILNSNLTGQTHITGGLFDRLNSIGTAGQVLKSTGTQVEWFTIPTVIPNLQQVLASGNTAVNNIILTGDLSANNAALLTSTISTSLTLLGTLRDGLSSVGTNNQVLSSNVTGVRWVNLPVYSAASPLLYNSGTGVFSIQQANASQDGYLSSADWITFDGKQTAISLTTTGNSGPSTLIGSTINVPNYTLAGLNGVPQTRTLTINGVTYNLSADRSWTIAAGVSSVTATSPLFSTGGATPNITIQQSSSSLDGYLSSVDWLTFNNKQPAGNYITSLTGEATAAGPGAASVTLSNAAVIGKLLTGLNITGSAISSSDSILTAFGKVQNQINGLIGGVQFQGVWNAATNTPALVSSVGTQGYYYIVSVAGNTNLNGITDWQVGDWAIFNGSTWNKVDNTDLVTSVNGQVGAVSLTTDNIPEGATNLYYLDSRARAALSFAAGSGAYNSTTGVITIPTDNSQILNGAGYITLVSLSATSPLTYNNTTGAFAIQVANTTQDGYLSSTDWNTFNGKQALLGGTGLVKSVGGTISYITDNSANWNTAYNDSIVSAAVTGTATKTLTLNQQDGGTITASWSDIDTGLTSVGVSMPTAFTVTNSPLTSNGTIAITGSGNGLQYIDGTGALQTFPSLTGFVPYTGATGSVNLGAYNLTATSLIKNGGTSGQFLKADGSVDSSAYIVLGSLSASAPLSYNNLTGAFSISQSGSSTNGYLSSTDWSIFNSKQDALTLTTTGTSGPSTLIGSTLNIPQYTDQFVGTVTSVAALTLGTIGTDLSSSVVNSTTTPVITLNVPTASAVNRGALSAADWNTFNNKQVAGNYITSLTGEATALGPGAAAVTLDNAAVIGKVLTGLNVTGGTVLAADSILTGFGKVQNQINGLIGGTIFQGTWNANTNTPALVSSVGTNGHYYIVSVAGTTNLDGITDWQVGDWAIFAGTTWEKVDNTDSVSSVNGFTGAVSLTTDNIPEGATNLYFTNTRARTAISLTTTGSSGASTYDNTTGVFNIPTYTDQFVGTVTSVGLSSVTSGVTIGSTPITTSGTITIAIATATASQNGLLSSTDWTTFNSKQGAITLTTTGTSGASTLVGNTLNIPNYTDSFVGTVTSVSFTLGSTGTNLSASVATSTTTPAITLNVPTASASARGALSSTDWTTFNNKQDAITLTTTGTSGAATLVGATLNIPQYQAAGTYVTSVTATSPLFSSGGTTPNITIQQASGSQSGFLSSTDWNTFNNKAPSVVGGYLPLSGGTMTGPINLFASQFYEGGGLFALNANNSDLIGLNGLYFNDLAETPSEGLNWYNTSTTWDSLWSASGVLYYTPNRASTTIGTSYTVYHSGNLSSPVTGTGANTRIAYWTGSGTLSGEDAFAYDATNNRVRINASAFDTAGVAAKLIVNGVLNAGSDATVQIDGFIRIKDQLLIHNGTNTAQDASIQAVGQGVLTVGNKLLINTSSISSYQLDVYGSASDVARFVAGSGDALVRIIANNYGTEADARLFLGENDTLGMTFEYDGQNNIGHIGMNDSVDPTGAFSKRISMPRAGTDTIFGAGNVLIGTSSPNGATLQVNGTATVSSTLNASGLITSNSGFRTNALNGYVLRNDGNNLNLGGLTRRGFWAGGTAADTQIFAETGYGIFLNTGGSTSSGLTLASTGAATFSSIVGVNGATEAGWALKSNGNLKLENSNGTTVLQVNDTSTGGKAWSLISSGAGNAHSVPAGTFYLRNSSDGLTALQVTAAGNLGLGVTPSAWTDYKVLQFGGGSISSYTDNLFIEVNQNAFWNGSSYVYVNNGFASRYQQNVGRHEWYTAPSGTATNAISFTQAMTLFANGDLAVGETSSNNSKLRVVADWNSGFSTVAVQGLSANQAGYGLYNIAGTRVGVWAYTGSVIYFETETSGINMNFNPAAITSMTLEGNGNVSIGRLTSGVTRADVYLSPSSTNAQLYFGRLSSTNDDNTKVYFVNRTGSAAMFVDTGAQRVQIKSDTTPNYTAYDLFVSRGDQYGGGIDVQSGLVRFRGDDDWLYINRAGTDVITIDNNNRVGIGTTSNNGKLQITGSHVGGYGMLNMNSADSCIIAMDSSTSWDVRLRYKFQGVDYWFAGMQDSNVWKLSKGDNTAVLYATQGNNVYIPNGGLQIASEGGFTGSAKFLVGSFLSAGSSAIAQFNGFLRIKDQLIIHNTSNTGLETYLQCTGSNALTTGGSITATSFFESSDARLKSNINDLSIDVSSIKAKIYEKDGKTEIGYLAQDVENILSGAVSKRDNGYLDLSYRQVHTAKINALEQKIKELEKQLNNK